MPALPKAYRRGCHRAVAPSETLARIRPHLAEMGITRVADVTGLDRIGIPVFIACRPNSRALAVSQGKGLDSDAARVSAIMESVESFHAETMRLPLEYASWRELSARQPVVDPARLQPSAASAFSVDLPLLWVCGEDWSRGGPLWVPHQIVHTNYTRSFVREPDCFLATSTGLASGNHLQEALSHALCETVERDAVHRFAQLPPAQRHQRQLDLATVDEPDCRELLRRFEDAGIAVAVWDVTGPVALPSFECLIVECDEETAWAPIPARGYGCHPARGIALMRALTEAAQSRLTLISGARDDIERAQVEMICRPDNVRAMRARAKPAGGRSFLAAPNHELASFDEDLALEMALLHEAGFGPVAVVDLSRPGLGVSVVRAIVPGLAQSLEN